MILSLCVYALTGASISICQRFSQQVKLKMESSSMYETSPRSGRKVFKEVYLQRILEIIPMEINRKELQTHIDLKELMRVGDAMDEEILKAKEELRRQDRRLHQLALEVRTLEIDTESKKTKVEVSTDVMQAVMEETVSADAEGKKLVDQVTKELDELNDLKDDLKNIEDSIREDEAQWKAKMEALSAEEGESRHKYEEMKAAFELLGENFKDQQRQWGRKHEELTRELQDLKTSLDNFEADSFRLDNSILDLVKQTSQAEEKDKVLDVDLKSVEEDIAKYEAQLAALRQGLQQQNADTKLAERELQGELDSSKQRILELKEQQSYLELQLRNTQEQIREASDDCNGFQRERQARDIDLEEQEQRYGLKLPTVKAVRDTIVSQTESTKRHIAELETQLHTKSTEIDAANLKRYQEEAKSQADKYKTLWRDKAVQQTQELGLQWIPSRTMAEPDFQVKQLKTELGNAIPAFIERMKKAREAERDTAKELVDATKAMVSNVRRNICLSANAVYYVLKKRVWTNPPKISIVNSIPQVITSLQPASTLAVKEIVNEGQIAKMKRFVQRLAAAQPKLAGLEISKRIFFETTLEGVGLLSPEEWQDDTDQEELTDTDGASSDCESSGGSILGDGDEE